MVQLRRVFRVRSLLESLDLLVRRRNALVVVVTSNKTHFRSCETALVAVEMETNILADQGRRHGDSLVAMSLANPFLHYMQVRN